MLGMLAHVFITSGRGSIGYDAPVGGLHLESAVSCLFTSKSILDNAFRTNESLVIA